MVEVTSARELLGAIETGQLRRHTSSTAMNRESSRSHLIMSTIIEATNLQTQNVTKGKLSFVDLAGSERCASPCCQPCTCLSCGRGSVTPACETTASSGVPPKCWALAPYPTLPP